jgi:hypothetical protein
LGINSPSDFSISNNNLVFAPQGPVRFASDSVHVGNIMTCTAISDPPYYRGTTFSGGMYIEVLATWPNGTEHGNEPSWPNAWTMPIKFLTGTGVVPYDFSEIDIFEAPFGRNFHQWSFVGEVLTDYASNSGTTPLGMKFGILLVPGSLNGGTPKLDYYANDVLVATSTPPSPYGTSVFETAANEPAALILGAAQSNPMTVQTVRVWQRPPSLTSISPDGSKIIGQPSGGGSGTLTTAYGKIEFGVFLATPDSTHAGTFNLPMLNGVAMNPGGPLVGAFGYPAMMQLWIANGGNLYGVGNDQLWAQWDGYYWVGNHGASFADGPAVTPTPGPLPTYNPPYMPAPDSASINNGSGSLTTIDGVWEFGIAGNGGWRARLNGIDMKHYEGSYHYFDQMTVASHGRMFLRHADGSGWSHWALNQRNKSTGPTAAPVPTNLVVIPSRTQVPRNAPAGTFVADVAVTLSDGSPFSGTYLLRRPDGEPLEYSMSGSKMVVSAPPQFGHLIDVTVSQNGSDLNILFVATVT